jgi:hypothetical protein
MLTMKKKNRRLLHLEALETRNLLSPLQGMVAQPLLSSLSPAQASDPSNPGPKTERVESPIATDAPKAALQSDHERIDQYSQDNSALQAVTNSTDADHGNPQGNSRQQSDGHSKSDGGPGSLQDSPDQNEKSLDAEVKTTDQQESESPDQTAANLTGTNDSEKDASGNAKTVKNDFDHAKLPDDAQGAVSQTNDGGGQKGGDFYNSNPRGELGSNTGSSTSSGDQESSANPGLPSGQTKDLEPGEGTVVSDGVGHVKANLARKDPGSPSGGNSVSADSQVGNSAVEGQPTSPGDLLSSPSRLRTELGEASLAVDTARVGSAGPMAANVTPGVVLDAGLFAASLATGSLEAGTDSWLPDLPRLAATTTEVLHTGVEVLAMRLGMGELASMETLSLGTYDLLLGFLPVDQESLDQAMQGFLSRVEDLGEQLTGSEAGTWLYPVILSALVVVHVASRRRRKSPKQQVWTVDRGSWMGNWFPSLSTLQK